MLNINETSFAVIIPVYNEEIVIQKCIEQVICILSKITEKSIIVVVDDGSTDSSNKILNSLLDKHKKLNLITNKINSGYGGALQSGIQFALLNGYKYVLFMDSDLTNDPIDIIKFHKKMVEGFDVIKATRYAVGGGFIDVNWKRILISKIGNYISCKLFGIPISDCTNGFRAIKTELYLNTTYTEKGFPFIVEELYSWRDKILLYCEISVVLKSRDSMAKSSSFVYDLNTYLSYLKYPFLAFIQRTKYF